MGSRVGCRREALPAPGSRCAWESGSRFPPSSCLWTLSTLSSEMGQLSKGIFKPSRVMSGQSEENPKVVFSSLLAWLTATSQSLLGSLGCLDCQRPLSDTMEPPGPPSSTSAPSARSLQPPLTPPLPLLQDSGPLQHMAAQGTILVSSICSSLRPRSKSQDSCQVGLDMERAWSSWDKGRCLMTRTCSFAGGRGLSLT